MARDGFTSLQGTLADEDMELLLRIVEMEKRSKSGVITHMVRRRAAEYGWSTWDDVALDYRPETFELMKK